MSGWLRLCQELDRGLCVIININYVGRASISGDKCPGTELLFLHVAHVLSVH